MSDDTPMDDPLRTLAAQELPGPLPNFWPWSAVVWATTDTLARISRQEADDAG